MQPTGQIATAVRPQPRQRGFILVLVLGFVVLLAWLATAVTAEVRRQIQLQGERIERTRLRPAAYQALELTIAALAEIQQMEKGFYSPAQGWGDPLRYLRVDPQYILSVAELQPAEGFRYTDDKTQEEEDPFAAAEAQARAQIERYRTAAAERDLEEPLQLTLSDPIIEPVFAPPVRVRVEVEEDSGKVALNHAGEERLKYLFEAMGFEGSESETLAQSLLDWIDRNEYVRPQGAESMFYQQLRPPYLAANRPVRDLRELRLVNGFRTAFFDEDGKPNAAFATLVQAVSVHKTDNSINLNTAPEVVLRMLEEEIGITPEDIERHIAGADMIRGTADDRILRPDLENADLPRDGDGNPLNFNVQARFLTVTVYAGAGNSVYTLRALIDLATTPSQGVYPFTIVQIVENGELY